MTIRRIRILAGLMALSVAVLASPARAGVINMVTANGYTFTNIDGPGGGGTVSTNFNGISNTGQVAGVTLDANMNLLSNFAGNPTGTLSTLNNTVPAMAFGINSAGTIVGGAPGFKTTIGGMPQALPLPSGATTETAFGINDKGMIVGQYTSATGTMPGFILNGTTFTTINAPVGPNVVNAQGINNNGLVVGFYVGLDDQVHGFTFDSTKALTTGTPVADPTIPPVTGEPGATFVFSQILGINDSGLAVGYYGDSTTSQHGFLYNTVTGKYTFLDDPNAAFHDGVEVTQITGITNSGELTGFYTDAGGVAHGFIAAAVPEPSSLTLLGLGLAGVLGFTARRRRVKTL